MGVLEGYVQESVGSGIWGLDMGTELDVGECGMGNWGGHVCIWGEKVVLAVS